MAGWIPELLRARPERPIVFRYVVDREPSAAALEEVVETLRSAGLACSAVGRVRWRATLPWKTPVYGAIRREIDEEISVELLPTAEGWQLELRCLPEQTHSAHAAGAAGVIAVAALVWIAGGWIAGIMPALTTLLAGGLWTEVTRTFAFGTLERRLRWLTADLGSELWPNAPAQLLPPPTRL